MSDQTSTFRLWLEEALTGWILPVAALAGIGLTALLYVLGLLGEEFTAALAVLVVAVGTALFMLRSALRRSGPAAALGMVAAAATALGVVLPALPTVWPGAALFEGDLAAEGATVAIPPGATGRLRLLVSGQLRPGGEPSASYTIAGTAEPVEGRLERTYATARVGRSGRTRVAHDHVADWYDAVVPEGTSQLTLRRVIGQAAGGLHLSAHRPLLPSPWPWVLAALALLLAAFAEARLGRKNAVAVPAGMALAFGLLVTYNATPAAAVGPAVGGVLLGALAGSLSGGLAAAVARRLIPADPA